MIEYKEFIMSKTNKKETNTVEMKTMDPIVRLYKLNEFKCKFIELKNQFIKGLIKIIDKEARRSQVYDEVKKVVEGYLIDMNIEGFQETLHKGYINESEIAGIRVISRFTNHGTDTMIITTMMDTELKKSDEDCFKIITEIKLPVELYSIMLKMEKVQDSIEFYRN